MATLKGTYWTSWQIGTSNANEGGDVRFFFKVYETPNIISNTSTMTVDCNARVYTHSELNAEMGGQLPVRLRAMFEGTYKSVTGNAYMTSEYHKTYDTKIGTITYTADHNDDGSGTTNNQNSGKVNSSIFSYVYSSYQVLQLTKINRGTSITSNANTSANEKDFGTDVTFTLTKANPDDTADIYYKVGDTTYNIAQATSDTSITYQFPTDLISNYPSNTQISLKVYCKTLSSNTIQETSVYLSVPTSYIPSVSLALEDTNEICSNWGIYVKTKSILSGVITASGISGSTIIGYSTNINDTIINTATFTSTALNPTIPSGQSTTTMNVISTVTDTRGRSNTDIKELIVYDYFAPTFVKCELKRCNQDGTLNSVGTYAKVVCQYKIASCNNNNTKKLTVNYGKQTKVFDLSNYEGTITADADMLFSDFDIDTNYTFTFTLEDSFTNYLVSVVLKNSYITRSFKAGGKGIAFGEDATADGFSCAMDANFKGEFKKNNVNVATINDLSKNIITVAKEGENNISFSAWNNKDLVYAVVKSQIGTNLSVNSSGQVVIGTGISYVKISSNCEAVSSSTNSGYVAYKIMKNDTTVCSVRKYDNKSSDRKAYPISSILVEVNECDVIYGRLQTAFATTLTVGGGDWVWLTVEEVKR